MLAQRAHEDPLFTYPEEHLLHDVWFELGTLLDPQFLHELLHSTVFPRHFTHL